MFICQYVVLPIDITVYYYLLGCVVYCGVLCVILLHIDTVVDIMLIICSNIRRSPHQTYNCAGMKRSPPVYIYIYNPLKLTPQKIETFLLKNFSKKS